MSCICHLFRRILVKEKKTENPIKNEDDHPNTEQSPNDTGKEETGYKDKSEEQHFEAIQKKCLKDGVLFEDPEFPADNSSLYFSKQLDCQVAWRRPKDIVKNPQFFVDGYSRFDVNQGILGDCWFLAVAAALTQNPPLFERVVLPNQNFDENYAGIFHFRFWQYGKWIDVVIDDRLPTNSQGKLLYMRPSNQTDEKEKIENKNEFWSVLLEKAYAKLYGSYAALAAGFACEAMVDLTGGVIEFHDLKKAPPNLFSILLKGWQYDSMFACSIEFDPRVHKTYETPEGLLRAHEYSITKVALMDIVTPNTTGKIQMLRLRNPWGKGFEWNGAWSDTSPEWKSISDIRRNEIGLNFESDGEFWMSFQDWLTHFNEVEICNLSPDALSEEQVCDDKRKWEMSMFEGKWTRGHTAAGCQKLETFCQNPQYFITLEDPDEDDGEKLCTIIIALMQKNRRSRQNQVSNYLTIGFKVYSVTDNNLAVKPLGMDFFKHLKPVAESKAFTNYREVSGRFKLHPGHYLIVPCTLEPDQEGEFLIRIFSEQKNVMENANSE